MRQATSITVHVPLNIRRRGGRKVVIAPDRSVLPQERPSLVPPTAELVLVKALARAFRWKRMLDEGKYASLWEWAKGERVKPSYAAGLLRLTLLVPNIVEAIMDGRQTQGLTLDLLPKSFPLVWPEQSGIFRRVYWPKRRQFAFGSLSGRYHLRCDGGRRARRLPKKARMLVGRAP